MKKITKTLAAATMAILVVGLAGCGGHTHTFSDKWTSDSANHWHIATCTDGDDCKTAISGKAAHMDADNDGKCDVCQYVTKATLTGGVALTPNDKGEMTATATGQSYIFDVDLVKKEATLQVYMSMDVGVIMTFQVLTDTVEEGAANCTATGKGVIAAVEGKADTYTAKFTYKYAETDATNTPTGNMLDTTTTITFKANNGVYTAALSGSEVEVEGNKIFVADEALGYVGGFVTMGGAAVNLTSAK